MDAESKNVIGFSFRFQKSIQPNKVDHSKLNFDSSQNQEISDFIRSVEDKQIKSTKQETVKEDLVIPLIKENKWRIPTSNQLAKDTYVKLKISDGSSLEEQAANEIISESKIQNEEREKSYQNNSLAIPLIMQNRVPEGYETDDKLDVSLRPDPSTLDDYERIPVDQFGLAMLRGMGWKPGEGIGLKNKRCVELIEVELRPKGLGLGADKKILENLKNKDNNGEELVLCSGAYVCIQEGNNKGLYGQIESLDEQTGRVYIRLALSGTVIHLPEIFLQVVNKKEYDKESKVINKSKYDEVNNSKNGETPGSPNTQSKKHSKKKKHRSRNQESKRDRSRSPTTEKPNKEYSKKSSKESSFNNWLIPELRVRLIDKNYRKGKFYKTKVIIEDVLSQKSCICRTEDGEILEDVHSTMLETVIPRNEPGYVMVVRGTNKRTAGKILHRDKSKCVAAVQLFPENHVIELSYDDISEYVGDISQYD